MSDSAGTHRTTFSKSMLPSLSSSRWTASIPQLHVAANGSEAGSSASTSRLCATPSSNCSGSPLPHTARLPAPSENGCRCRVYLRRFRHRRHWPEGANREYSRCRASRSRLSRGPFQSQPGLRRRLAKRLNQAALSGWSGTQCSQCALVRSIRTCAAASFKRSVCHRGASSGRSASRTIAASMGPLSPANFPFCFVSLGSRSSQPDSISATSSADASARPLLAGLPATRP